jgi:small-conductance mechanosensitive channel
MSMIVLAVFGISVEAYVVPFITTAVSFVFIFGNSLKDVWESCVFIFYVRPFDVGDYFRLSLDPPTYVVHRIRMLVTECFTTDGRLVIIPNPKLYTSMIYSYKRSKSASVSCNVQVAHTTTKDQVLTLQEYVMKWMRDTKTPYIWEVKKFGRWK